MATYNHKAVESKWQSLWEENKTFLVDLKTAKNPFYNLVMFPYPSAEGLHVGHIVPYSGADTYGRFMRMRGHDVFEPMGFDAFGIHSENFAIEKGIHPAKLIAQTTRYFRENQMKRLGTLFDWSRSLSTTDPAYYKWTQWIFLEFYKAGLAYKKQAPVTYCLSCKTVLADEQTEKRGEKTVCERCKNEIEKRQLSQWFFKITKYADRLLNNLANIDWPETTKILQKNWIGKSEGIDINYEVVGTNEKITCFTTRPDTNYGATFVVLAPEHPLVLKITTDENSQKVKDYIKRAKSKTEQERISEARVKTGIFTGSYCLNQLTGKKMPIYISDFVIMTYGTGAVVGVPGHDKRDFEFAQKFNLSIVRVVVGPDGDAAPITKPEQVQEEQGTMVNSDLLNGLDIQTAIKTIMDYIEKKGWGRRKTTLRLRDWCISRQRYWGPPIPMINCSKCGWQPVPESDLPVLLPDLKDYQPDEQGKPPLARVSDFVNTTCPKCSGPATRETDVSDTFLDSAWYFFRYLDPANDKIPFPTQGVFKKYNITDDPFGDRWLPVNIYIGGNEHACMHLLYTRFLTMVFKDLGFINFEEPFKKFFAHGLIIKDGAKMSKSRGNIINPDEYLDKYGADTLRMYILFLGPYSAGGDFKDEGIGGINRFLTRIWQLVETTANKQQQKEPIKSKNNSDIALTRAEHKAIKAVTKDLESLKFNTALARIMEYYNAIYQKPTLELVKTLLLLLAPLAPHITEELWQKINNVSQFENQYSIHNQPWPDYDSQLAKEELITIAVQVNGRLRTTIEVSPEEVEIQKRLENMARNKPAVRRYLAGQKPKKVIFVKGKIINFVV